MTCVVESPQGVKSGGLGHNVQLNGCAMCTIKTIIFHSTAMYIKNSDYICSCFSIELWFEREFIILSDIMSFVVEHGPERASGGVGLPQARGGGRDGAPPPGPVARPVQETQPSPRHHTSTTQLYTHGYICPPLFPSFRTPFWNRPMKC